MKLTFRRFDLLLRHRWAISTDLQQGGWKSHYPVVLVELSDSEGRRGVGEASPSSQYHETHATVTAFLSRVDPARLSFADIPASMAYLETLGPGNNSAQCALSLALFDGAARAAGQPVYQFIGLPAAEGAHFTSFTIGIDAPEIMAAKAVEAAAMPVLKLKLGSPDDRQNFAAVRAAAPDKPIRVDANAGWKTAEESLRNIEWLAADGNVQFVEQPLAADLPEEDWLWLKARSPLPIFGDESYHSAADADRCARCFHGVNVKLVKSGGISAAKVALEAARVRGLKTMIGCMIESSVLITAGAHLAALADFLDLDGNLLITNDPYRGVRCVGGRLTFMGTPPEPGLGVEPVEN